MLTPPEKGPCVSIRILATLHGKVSADAWAFKMLTEGDLKRSGAFKLPTGSDLVSASRCGKLDEVRKLVNSGSDIEQRDANGCSALYMAALYGHEEIARFLLSCGADTEAATDSGATPLYASITKRHAAVSQLLLGAGASRAI
jgi:ankyrin repeat protein